MDRGLHGGRHILTYAGNILKDMGIIELDKGSNIAMQNRIKETYWKIWIFKQEIYLEADTYKHLLKDMDKIVWAEG